MTKTELIRVGHTAAEFTLLGHDGASYHLADMRKQGHVMLVFYPGNNTPG